MTKPIKKPVLKDPPVKFCVSCCAAMHSAMKWCPNCGEPATQKAREDFYWPKDRR